MEIETTNATHTLKTIAQAPKFNWTEEARKLRLAKETKR
jgi:hypothetical protein